MPRGANTLTIEQIGELRAWARSVLANGAVGELGSFASVILPLAEEAARRRQPGGEAGLPAAGVAGLDAARRRAAAVVDNGAPAEVRAAARAVLLLAEDLGPEPHEAREVGEDRGGPAAALAVLGVLAAIVAGGIVLGGGTGTFAARAVPALVGKEQLKTLAFAVPGDVDTAAGTTWLVDGRLSSRSARVEGELVVFRPGRLRDGRHTVQAEVPGGFLAGVPRSWSFSVDTKRPTIRVARDSIESPRGGPYHLRGTVEPGASLTVNGRRVPVGARGGFSLTRSSVPSAPLVLRARDTAGNLTDARLRVRRAPRYPGQPLRAVHVSADGWADGGLRRGVLRMLGEHRVNAVEIDLKDESGIVGWRSGVSLADRVGAYRDLFDLRAVASMLHRRGVRVIGRIVAFRDPKLAAWAWRSGRHDLVTQTPDGSPYAGGYGGFTSFASPVVRDYNVDLAEAAARQGVDDVLYDYVRRPDGPLSSMVVPGLRGDPARAVTALLAETRRRLEPLGTFLGASVFGIAATRPAEIAQDVRSMAREVDYIAPMLYPSHWGAYEYGIPNPDRAPYAIVRRSLADFEKAMRGTGARLVPWLQDFSLGATYGPSQVAAQIRAARDAGVDEFLLWDPTVTYTADALRRTARLPATGTRAAVPGSGTLVALRPSRSPDDPVPTGLRPNELGVVPVIMYHQILPDGGGDYDLTPEQFRAELERLHRAGYRPVRASDYANGTIDLPRGASPVVLTFDDSTGSQAALTADGRIDPQTAVGIMLAFAREHPDWRPAGTLYVNRAPFAAEPRAAELARKLEAAGFELGNHSLGHVRFDGLRPDGVEREIVQDNRLVRSLVGKAPETIALPFGIQPDPPGLALAGSWGGEEYRFAAAFLTGAEPAPSPFSKAFDPLAVPRIRSDPGRLEFGSSDWLRRLKASPELRYVSDGKPRRITFPESRAAELAVSLRARGHAYTGS